MNLPNQLTVARLGLTAVFVACLTAGFPGHNAAGFAVFLVAVFTDWLDGEIARRRHLVTNFGKLMDPLADKILTASAFICLVGSEAIASWAAILIISREFLITGLRTLAATRGVVLPAENLGKHKTAWQMAAILYLLALMALEEFYRPAWMPVALDFGTWVLVPVAVLLSVVSGVSYLLKNRQLLSEA